jgi:hypothetical protein
MPEDRFAPPEEMPMRPARETDERAVEAGRREGATTEAFGKEPLFDRVGKGPGASQAGDESADGEPEEDQEDEFADAEPGQRRWGRTVAKILVVLLFALLVAGGVALWVLPEVRQQALQWASPWLRAIPGMENLVGNEPPKSREASAVPIRLKEVRQRSVANLLAGNLHVVEGFAVNLAPYPVAKVRVRLMISDAYDVVLGERFSFCGNLLSDAELSTLAEAEIQRELSNPQGSDVPNARIAPNGEIPFQLVFSQEQAGAIKTVVMPAGAERIP